MCLIYRRCSNMYVEWTSLPVCWVINLWPRLQILFFYISMILCLRCSPDFTCLWVQRYYINCNISLFHPRSGQSYSYWRGCTLPNFGSCFGIWPSSKCCLVSLSRCLQKQAPLFQCCARISICSTRFLSTAHPALCPKKLACTDCVYWLPCPLACTPWPMGYRTAGEKKSCNISSLASLSNSPCFENCPPLKAPVTLSPLPPLLFPAAARPPCLFSVRGGNGSLLLLDPRSFTTLVGLF